MNWVNMNWISKFLISIVFIVILAGGYGLTIYGLSTPSDYKIRDYRQVGSIAFASMVCPKCNEISSNDDKYCDKCGSKLIENKFAPRYVKCSSKKCYNIITTLDQYCKECGTKNSFFREKISPDKNDLIFKSATHPTTQPVTTQPVESKNKTEDEYDIIPLESLIIELPIPKGRGLLGFLNKKI